MLKNFYFQDSFCTFIESYSRETREHEVTTQSEWQIRHSRSRSPRHCTPAPPPVQSASATVCNNASSSSLASSCGKPVSPAPVPCCKPTPTPCGTGNKINANAMYVNASDHSSVKVYVNGRKYSEDCETGCDGKNQCLGHCGKVCVCRPACNHGGCR